MAVPVDRAARFHRRYRGMDHDRGRSTTLDRLRPAAHRRLGDAVAERRRRGHLAGLLCRGLPADVPDRHRDDGGHRAPRLSGREPRRRPGRGRPPGPALYQRRAMSLDLVPLWTFLLGLAVFYYVVFDGFDLGVGILYGFARDEAARHTMMNSIAPIWDGNETWLVFGGLGLLAAFPLAFSIIIPGVYFPILVMLLSLVFRGVAFEFRFNGPLVRRFWDRAFPAGSALATFAQGVVLGSFIQGFRVDGRHFAGGSFDWATPFALLTGVALMFGYGLLGAGWLVLK